MNVMIVVTHLLGSGHLVRALVIADAFRNAGHVCTVVSGGVPFSHPLMERIVIEQLPPLRSNGVDFTTLLDETGERVSDTLMSQRTKRLTEILNDRRPDVVITELYPFGRRILQNEFQVLLASAKSQVPYRPLICASIRDILAPPSKPEKAAQTLKVLKSYYDAVLVHSDENIMPLQASWPTPPDLVSVLHYTGFVAPPAVPSSPDAPGRDEVLVSAGGGNVGDAIYSAALEAAAKDAPQKWRLLVGGSDAKTRCANLNTRAPDNAIVEPARPDFRQMLPHASASISMCGYNTAIDVLQSGVPAVLVPFDGGNEVEQSLRAKSLSQLSGIEMLKERDLTDTRLLHRLAVARSAPKRDTTSYRLDGAEKTVRIVENLRSQLEVC